MAITAIGSAGTFASKAGTDSLIPLVTSATVESGNVLFLIASSDNPTDPATSGGAETNDHVSVSDSATGTWVKLKEWTTNRSALAGQTCSMWVKRYGSQLNSGSTITVTLSGDADARSAATYEFTVGADLELDQDVAREDLNADPGALAITPADNREWLFVRGIGIEGVSTTALTPTTNWTNIAGNQTTGGGATANSAVRGEFRIITTGSIQTSDPSWDAANDCASILVNLKEAAGGTAHTAEPDDDVSLADAQAKARGLGLTESPAVADSFSRSTVTARSVPDAVALTDQAALAQGKAQADSVALADNLTRVLVYARTITDSVSLSDDISPQKSGSGTTSVDDSVLVSDLFSRAVTASRSVSDSVSLSDSISTLLTKTVTVDDSVGLADLFARVATYVRTPADQLALTDALLTAHPRSVTIDDLVALDDAQDIFNGIITTLLDPIYTGHIGYGEQGEISDTVGGIVEVEEVVEV